MAEETGWNGSGTLLSAFGKEFHFAQDRRIAQQARLREMINRGLAILEATELLEQMKQMTKAKKPFKGVIKVMKPVLAPHKLWNNDTEHLYLQYMEIENYLKEVLEASMLGRPIWSEWLTYVDGIGLLTAAEMVAGFESAFKPGEGWEHFVCVSQMWGFSGLNVDERGKAPKRTKFQKASYNSGLRSILVGRIGKGLLRGKGQYFNFYRPAKADLTRRFSAPGWKIVPSKKLPMDERGKKYEPEGVISQDHLNNMAVRVMVKLLVSHLFEMVNKLELGVKAPRRAYVLEVLRHPHYIAPFFDKPGVTHYPASQEEAAG